MHLIDVIGVTKLLDNNLTKITEITLSLKRGDHEQCMHNIACGLPSFENMSEPDDHLGI